MLSPTKRNSDDGIRVTCPPGTTMGVLEKCALWGLQWGFGGNAPSGSCNRTIRAQHSLSTAMACVRKNDLLIVSGSHIYCAGRIEPCSHVLAIHPTSRKGIFSLFVGWCPYCSISDLLLPTFGSVSGRDWVLLPRAHGLQGSQSLLFNSDSGC